MRKILALCLSLVMLATCTTTAFAYEDSCAGSGETEILAHLYSTYSISIPATIDLTAGMTGEVTIIDANIEYGYKVDVYVTNLNQFGAVTLTHTSDSTSMIDCMLTNIEQNLCATSEVPLVTFFDSELTAFGTATKYFGLDVAPFGLAGQYTGTMTYSFSCSPYIT